MIKGINHITLACTDINTSFDFYKNILGLVPLCKWDKGAYFLAGSDWICLSVDQTLSERACYTHYAFTVEEDDFDTLSRKIIYSGVKIFKENKSEGPSLYFLDPDGHKLEIHVGDWQSRIKEKKSNPGSWQNIEWFE